MHNPVVKRALLALFLVLAANPVSADPVAAVFLNSYDANNSVYYSQIGTLAGPGCYVEVWGGVDAAHLAPLADWGGNVVFDLRADGFFDAGWGIVPGLPPVRVGSFQIIAWKGQPTPEGWQTATAIAQSAIWSQITGGSINPPSLDEPASLQFPANLVIRPIPEPSMFLLGLSGALIMVAHGSARRVRRSRQEPRCCGRDRRSRA